MISKPQRLNPSWALASSFLASHMLLITACTDNDPAEVCNPSAELDLSRTGLPPGMWFCPFGASMWIDADGKPRWLEVNPVQRLEFGCADPEHLPLVKGDPNVKAGRTHSRHPHVGYIRELVDATFEPRQVVLSYELGYADAEYPERVSYGFRRELNGQVAYYRRFEPLSDIVWQICVDHPVTGDQLGTSADKAWFSWSNVDAKGSQE